MLQARRVLLSPLHLNVPPNTPALRAAWKHSRSAETAHDFVYFHTPEIDLFWHYLERSEDGQARSLDLSSAQYSEKQQQWHNQRVCDDWHDYRQGIHDRPDKLQRLQVRHRHGDYTPVGPGSRLEATTLTSAWLACRSDLRRTCWTMHTWRERGRCSQPSAGARTHPMRWRCSGCRQLRALPHSCRCSPALPTCRLHHALLPMKPGTCAGCHPLPR